jgi:glycosyltransferase involved in cell wall biosynthesis
MHSIPKIIHQLWIGNKPPPTNLMNTWKNKHPEYEYIYWNEEEIIKRNFQFKCHEKIKLINEINGKADIMRWEILYQYGGIFIDADSICIEPLDDFFLENTGFASFENEECRNGLIATGTMGFIPSHSICKNIIDWINSEESIEVINSYRAWFSVGPALFTRFLNSGEYKDITIYPSYYFLPHHFTGSKYVGHKKVYAHQEWGTANNSYETMNSSILPMELNEPPQDRWVSILISSFNTSKKYVSECLQSIRKQNGYYGFEIVWINDGSTANLSKDLENELTIFKNTTRFCKVVYEKLNTNMGLYDALSYGVEKCSYPMIFRMDSDDIMFPCRIDTQYKYMKMHPEVKICSAGIRIFINADNTNTTIMNNKDKINVVHPPIITKDDFLKNRYGWIMNQPTMCFYKQDVVEIGNYNCQKFHKNYMEDYALELRYLNKYGCVHNMQEVLLHYRVHANQLTQIFGANKEEELKLKNTIIDAIFYF